MDAANNQKPPRVYYIIAILQGISSIIALLLISLPISDYFKLGTINFGALLYLLILFAIKFTLLILLIRRKKEAVLFSTILVALFFISEAYSRLTNSNISPLPIIDYSVTAAAALFILLINLKIREFRKNGLFH